MDVRTWISAILIQYCTTVVASDPITKGQEVIQTLYHRYNSTQAVDLIFVLDRSGSVPPRGWVAILNFVRDVLEHFTVDEFNTRVSVVSFGTTASVDINDLEPNLKTSKENKCTLNDRILALVETQRPRGYTATSVALSRAHQVLMRSRAEAKKAVIVVTDGRSNIGHPPVREAIKILSLRWTGWDEIEHGPQVEIFSFGLEAACLPELQSIASPLDNHVFHMPNFTLFMDFARSLHGDTQQENWQTTSHAKCFPSCTANRTFCACGAKVGQYACVCEPGSELNGEVCKECAVGFFKKDRSPEKCQKCPPMTTTWRTGASSEDKCEPIPGFKTCPSLPDIPHGFQFRVSGIHLDEVENTGVPCEGTTDGNSCHYGCRKGYRLNGMPVMICNASGEWEGDIPQCNVVNCGVVHRPPLLPLDADVVYLNSTLTYGSIAQVTCHGGRVSFGTTTWKCNQFGQWTKPKNFECVEVYCPPLKKSTHQVIHPEDCAIRSGHSLGTTCAASCSTGYQLKSSTNFTCVYDGTKAYWHPANTDTCKDILPPVIQCPDDVTLSVINWNDSSIVFHYDGQSPITNDNSGAVNYTITGAPPGNIFKIGYSQLTYTASDSDGNTASCTRSIVVHSKQIQIEFCPGNISIQVNQPIRNRIINWTDPVFVGPGNTVLEFSCSLRNGGFFGMGLHHVLCYPHQAPSVNCKFYINVTGFELRYHDPDHVFKCGWSGNWDIVGDGIDAWPQCYRSRRAYSALTANRLSFQYSGECENEKDGIRADFISTMFAILEAKNGPCPSQVSCKLDNVSIICGGDIYEQTRFRRDIEPTTSADAANLHIYFDIEGQLKETHNVNSRTQKSVLYALHDVNTWLDDEVSTQEMSFGNSSRLFTPVSLHTLRDPGLILNCPDEEIADTTAARCLTCPRGSSMSNDDCVLCPLGYFKEVEGDSQCIQCPGAKSTPHRGARSSSECRAPCSAGSSSPSGLEPCPPCPVGFYQSDEGSTQCRMCPNGYSTLHPGAEDIETCIEKCNSNSYSETGLFPCQPCPPGTHQPARAQTICLSCAGLNWDPESCPGDLCEVEADACESDPCENQGLCLDQTVGFTCLCAEGYTGSICTEDVNECASGPCQNGACVDLVAGYKCLCQAGFAEVASNFDLVFPSASIHQHADLPLVQDLAALTLCLWLRSSDLQNRGTICSYSSSRNGAKAEKTFTIYDYGDVQLYVNGKVATATLALNDGRWHHVCVVWESKGGEWMIYGDGFQQRFGRGLAPGTTLAGGGHFILGQDQDLPAGGFNGREAFVGEMSQVYVINRTLNASEVKSMAEWNAYDACTPPSDEILKDAVIKWTDVLDNIEGNIIIRNTSLCGDANACVSEYSCPSGSFCVDKPNQYVCMSCNGVCERVCQSKVCSRSKSMCYDDRMIPTGAWTCHCDCDDYSHSPCDSNPCFNGGTCIEADYSYFCHCKSQFTGALCETLISACPADFCANNSTCLFEDDHVTCDCSLGYFGYRCQIIKLLPPDLCALNPCFNHGTCIEDARSPNGYSCKCPRDLVYGPNCEVVSGCVSEPCMNGATCLSTPAYDYHCLCPYGFRGLLCEIDLRFPGDFSASTSTTLLPSTETDINTILPTTEIPDVDLCVEVKCQHGGTCVVMKDQSVSCQCPMEVKGSHCEVLRETDIRHYHVEVTLLKVYQADLTDDASFKQEFQNEIHKVYSEVLLRSKIYVHITNIRTGSTIVEFRLSHVVFNDVRSAGLIEMRRILRAELIKGQLGAFNASEENFVFTLESSVSETPPQVFSLSMLALIGGIPAVCLLLVTAVIIKSQIENPMFESNPDFQAPQLRNIIEENIYAEPTEPNTAYTSRKEVEDPQFPAKHGRDINKVWATSYHKQQTPLPPKPDEDPYLGQNDLDSSIGQMNDLDSSLCHMDFPPCYQDVFDHVAQKDASYKDNTRLYLTPLSDEEAARCRQEKTVNSFHNNDYLYPTNSVKK
ncbi:hypothetical protein CAPTEDRAFT_199677 [Capitella teleta]|uniref:Sushi, von Willebrand factor type A, EGF and pentraxin domain-containing protein 1 n=1 Tax=Capitella teleta TaxID=283909 RepID=R7U8K0_CAPTE|nr:hypothetical protein CAPTEDRAFT_199677 [Capitella teleta]|eukprot:ELU02705.1 hypothetical protein CAPTEDRAFT_199677 [Capitella teleta]